MIISAEKKAPPDSTAQALQRLAAEELAGAVDVGDPEAEEDPVGQAVRARVEGADERVGALDPEADDDVGLVGSASRSIRRPRSATWNWRSPSVNATRSYRAAPKPDRSAAP